MAFTTARQFKRSDLQSISDVERALEKLEQDIPAAQMKRLTNFNRTYLAITRNVKAYVEANYFEQPDFLQRFDSLFAAYYIDAVKNHLLHRDIFVPPAWKYAFLAAEKGTASSFKCMALGVNAHINNDIPQVLLELKASDQHTRDYYFVNDIIKASLNQILIELDPSNRLLRHDRRMLRPLTRFLMHGFVLVFRRLAWRNFRLLQKCKIHRYLIELRSRRVAMLINILPI